MSQHSNISNRRSASVHDHTATGSHVCGQRETPNAASVVDGGLPY